MTDEKDLIRDDIEAYLAKYQKKEMLRFVSVGSVDDGKSTLIGRILYDTAWCSRTRWPPFARPPRAKSRTWHS